MDAREFFESVRSAVRARQLCGRRIERMRAAEGVKAQGYDAMPTGKGGVSDKMAATDARIDYEAQAARELAQYDAIVADGMAVCAGVRTAHPSLRWGYVLEMRYCQDMKWDAIAADLCVSPRMVQSDAYAALDWVDAVGVAAAREGCGQTALPLV